MFCQRYFTKVNSSFCKLVQVLRTEYTVDFRSVQTSVSVWNGNTTDPERINLFFDNEVQDLLKKLTRKDLNFVFRSRKMGQKLEPPEYKFMTTEQLEKVIY
uniref:Uncharacterized protein n=1 Tax=Clastoptera arizonana TaxID=38151 RepID=A0A1B6DY21_9HEMI